MTDKKFTIALIGCGRLGTAMLNGWVRSACVNRALVVDHKTPAIPSGAADIRLLPGIAALTADISSVDMLIIAVKPHNIAEVLAELRPVAPATLPILSVAAGITLSALEHGLHPHHPLIRTMPNTPGAIGQGITAAVATHSVTPGHKSTADALLAALGDVVWLESESQMDAVTGVSGSGPAYVFAMIDALAAAGVKVGLDGSIAMRLARQTVIGAAALAASTPDKSAEDLRHVVTSPGGTTQAGLSALLDGRFQEIMNETVARAAERSRALSS